MSKKYCVISDWTRSKGDGDDHLVSNDQLVRLYGVDRKDCSFAPPFDKRQGWRPPKGSIILLPRYDGDYTCPTHQQ